MNLEQWKPPFFLFSAGREQVCSTSYRNEALDAGTVPRRLLIKHTLSGTGTVYIRGRRELLQPGSIFVIERSGPYCYCYEEVSEPWCFEFVSIGYECAGELLPAVLRDDPVYYPDADDELMHLLKELIARRLSADYQDKLMHSALAYRFFLYYISVRMRHRAVPVPEAAVRLKKMLDNGFCTIGPISDCCRLLGYSAAALTRVFSQSYGMPPGRYLTKLRLRHACELLREGSISVKEAAFACGFNSQNYFGRTFRRVLGTTPGKFRRNADLLLPEKLYDGGFDIF